MADSESFRVIIAGGGITGLTLANALEKAGIDFIVLERQEVAPQIGASISIHCNTVKIFEQLGVWQRMCEATLPLTDRRHFDEHGNLFEASPIFKQVTEKTRRPIVALERRFCLATLYDNLLDKSRIRTNTGVVSFTEDESGITVLTHCGESIRGSILVAADGVHSTIRNLLADSISKYDTERYNNLVQGFTSNYKTVFGTSTNYLDNDTTNPVLPYGVVHLVYYKGVSGITAAGAKGLIFWFLFVKEEIASRMPNCPRYTDLDAVATIEKYGDLAASPSVTFRKLWETKIKAGIVPMEDGVIQGPWNNGGRVVLVGDAIHKTTVNTGFGGNLAVEGVTNFVNELVPLLRRTKMPTTQDIATVFGQYERRQRPRADTTVQLSNHTTRYESMDSLWLRILRWVSPWVPQWYKVRGFLGYMEQARILNFLPDPDTH
ncbi:FAD/NAD(P)-binding domain-containing protein [Hypoxylon crocopeplum]|nr:FAD/NAD(P)-binding domain-containing protein [Hypoxylon crocopeplum]